MQLYLRGARGEDLGELGDFDKRMALLTQRLASEEDEKAALKSLQTQAHLFDNLLRPLFSALYTRFGRVDSLFAHSDSLLHGYTSADLLIGKGSSRRARLLDFFQQAATHELNKIELFEMWRGFRADPSKELNFSVVVALGRSSFNLDASASGLGEGRRLQAPYDDLLGPEDVERYASEFLSLLSQGLERLLD